MLVALGIVRTQTELGRFIAVNVMTCLFKEVRFSDLHENEGAVQINVLHRFEVLTAVVMKSTVLWDIRPCSPLKVNQRFGGTYRLHIQGRRISRDRTSVKAGGKQLYPRRQYSSNIFLCHILLSCCFFVGLWRFWFLWQAYDLPTVSGKYVSA
jgi:hypothetical protein